jgi:hypothetical protein
VSTWYEQSREGYIKSRGATDRPPDGMWMNWCADVNVLRVLLRWLDVGKEVRGLKRQPKHRKRKEEQNDQVPLVASIFNPLASAHSAAFAFRRFCNSEFMKSVFSRPFVGSSLSFLTQTEQHLRLWAGNIFKSCP